MKKFFQVCTTIKEVTALCYTAAMCFYLFFQWVFKQETAPLSILFSLLLVCIAAGTMQVVAFSDLLFKKLAYGWWGLWCPLEPSSPPRRWASAGSPPARQGRGCCSACSLR